MTVTFEYDYEAFTSEFLQLNNSDYWTAENVAYFDGRSVEVREQLRQRVMARSEAEKENVLTIVLSASPRLAFYPTERIGPATILALEKFYSETPDFRKFKFDVVLLDDDCLEYSAMKVFMDYNFLDIDAIFSMRCTDSVRGVVYYLTYQDIPVFVNAVMEPLFDNKEVFQTLIRMSDTFKYAGETFTELFRAFKWRRMGAIAPLLYNKCEKGMKAIRDAFYDDEELVVAEWIEVQEDNLSDSFIHESLVNLKQRTRVILLCVDPNNMLRVLTEAKQLDMLTPDYVYLTLSDRVDEFVIEPWGTRPDDFTDEQWEERKSLYKYLKMITFIQRDSLEDVRFMENTYEMAFSPPFNYSAEEVEEMTAIGDKGLRETIAVYEGVYEWMRIVRNLIDEGENPRSGRTVLNRMRNEKFLGITNPVALDSNADYISNYVIWEPCESGDCFKKTSYIWVSHNYHNLEKELGKIHWLTSEGNHPPDVPECGFFNEYCQESQLGRNLIIGGTLSGAFFILIVGILIAIWNKKISYDLEVQKMIWKVEYTDIQFKLSEHLLNSLGKSLRSMAQYDQSCTSLQEYQRAQIFANLAIYKGKAVAVKEIKVATQVQLNKDQLIELKQMKDLSHDNLNSFVGACIRFPDVYLLSHYCSKGSLQDIIENDEISLDRMFKTSLINDIVNGMMYLHNSSIQVHGSLKSSHCLIDGRWVLKISGFGLPWLRNKNPDNHYDKDRDMLWMAPELLKDGFPNNTPTQKSDVYSFSIILQELIYRAYHYFTEDFNVQDIVAKIRQGDEPPFRPMCNELPRDTDPVWVHLMKECWEENPDQRPPFGVIKKVLIRANGGRKINIVDSMIQKLESYAHNLEGIVSRRTEELVKEKRKTDELLYRMMPRSVAEKLKAGELVQAELYDAATVYFSDIVGFTSLASISTPIQVVNFLNDLYTCFDAVIASCDVYKVETIGDAYLCVSGIPNRNGDRHVTEVANMALAIRSEVSSFMIHHFPDKVLKIRIGIHTGPCAAGVVGLTMPRYCLFGDTVNMASRMESNSEAMKIQVSEATYNMLSKTDEYCLTHRGQIQIKGKGLVNTYWLDEKHSTE